MRVQVFSLYRVGAFAGAAKDILVVLQMLRAKHIGHSSAYLVNGIGTVRHSFHNSHQTVVVCAAQSIFLYFASVAGAAHWTYWQVVRPAGTGQKNIRLFNLLRVQPMPSPCIALARLSQYGLAHVIVLHSGTVFGGAQ